MVLETAEPRTFRTHRALGILLVAAGMLLAGCIKSKPPTRLAQPTAVASAYVLSFPDRPEIAPVPDSVRKEIDEELGKRNLQPMRVEADRLADSFQRKRETRDRLEVLAKQAGDAPLVMLVESQVRYYSQLEGRYRWDVDGRITFAPTSDLTRAHSVNFSRAAFLEYAHQDEDDALRFVERSLAGKVGQAADRFLTGLDSSVFEEPSTATEDPQASPATPRRATPRARNPDPFPGFDAIYFVMVDRFENGDPTNDADADPSDPQAFHGGDLRGVYERLDWLENLGVKTVWLSPVFEMRTEKFHGHGAFHGYWIEDFAKIEPRFGAADTLELLAEELDRRGMRLLLDVVLNHVGPGAPLVEKKPDWFHGKGGVTDWDDPEQLLTYDVHGLPDLDQSNPEVFDYLVDRSLYWVENVGPEGFRLDAVKHVPNDFWRRYHAKIEARVGPGFVLLGELLDGNPSNVAETMAEGDFNSMFDFPLHFAMVDVFCRDAHPGRLASVLFNDRLYPAEVQRDRSRLVTLLDNHDLPRILSVCGDQEARVNRALRFMLTARGTPSFTWGTEVGLRGMEEPANRKDMKFGDLHPVGTSMKSLLELRRQNPVFLRGRDHFLALTDDFFAYQRTSDDQVAVIVVNLGEKVARVALPEYVGDARPTNTFDASVDAGTLEAAGESVSVALFSGDFRNVMRASGPPRMRETVLNVGGIAPERDVEARLVGSGPELGNWSPTDGVSLQPRDGKLQARLKLPVGGAFAFKIAVRPAGGDWQWMPGDNRYLFVDDADGPLVESFRTK